MESITKLFLYKGKSHFSASRELEESESLGDRESPIDVSRAPRLKTGALC